MPAVMVVPADETSRNLLAAAGLTVMLVSAPVTVALAVSVAVRDCVPAVLSVALKVVCLPLSDAVKV